METGGFSAGMAQLFIAVWEGWQCKTPWGVPYVPQNTNNGEKSSLYTLLPYFFSRCKLRILFFFFSSLNFFRSMDEKHYVITEVQLLRCSL